jgi:predicted helicase
MADACRSISRLPLDAVNEAVYAAIPKKLGDREYWSEWAKSIGPVAERLIARIKALIDTERRYGQGIRHFPEGLAGHVEPRRSKTRPLKCWPSTS